MLENTVAELVFTGPVLLRLPAIHRRNGRADEAERLERRFAELWRGADPGLSARVLERFGR